MTSYVCFPSFHVSWKDLIFCFTCFEMHCLKKVMSKLFFVWHSSFFSNWCYSLFEAYFPWLVPFLSHALTFLTLSFLSYVSHEVTSSSCVHSHICLFHPPVYSTWKSCPFLISTLLKSCLSFQVWVSCCILRNIPRQKRISFFLLLSENFFVYPLQS